MKFFNQFANKPPVKGEKDFSESLTLPDMTMTIPELMSRYARGLSLDDKALEKVPVYDLTDEDIAIARADRMTKIQYIREKAQAALDARQEQLDRIKEAQEREREEFQTWKLLKAQELKNDPQGSTKLPGTTSGDTGAI